MSTRKPSPVPIPNALIKFEVNVSLPLKAGLAFEFHTFPASTKSAPLKKE